jgi:phospholipase/carboxylesterase
LAPLAAQVDAQTLVVLPRGPRSIAGERWGWFREGYSEEEGPQVVLEEARESRDKLVEFVGQLQQRFGVGGEDTIIGGFSQGAMLCAGAALHAPERLRGLAMVGGRVLPEFDVPGVDAAPGDGSDGRAVHLHVLVVHGREDEVVPVACAREAGDRWRALGALVEQRLHGGGHALTPAMEKDVLDWWSALHADAGTGGDRAAGEARA